jgi:hypothetical protein
MKRPVVITIWAIIFALGAAFDVVAAVNSYVLGSEDYNALNPGPLGVFRPIAWVGVVFVPIGLWFMRFWGVWFYVLLQAGGVLLTFIAQPAWLQSYPAWALPLSLVIPAIFILTTFPTWRTMSLRIP